jgi:hypothetical protein
MTDCEAEYILEIQTHERIVIVSLVLTAVKIVACSCCKENPKLPKFNIIAGCVKIFLAIALWTFFYPKCPDGCVCADYLSLYPFIALFLGFLWISQGYKAHQQQMLEQAASQVVGAEDKEGTFVDSNTIELSKSSTTKESSGRDIV